MRFPVVVIDPPVPFAGWTGHPVAEQYDLMTWDDLKGLGPLIDAVTTDDAAMFLWLCQPLLIETVDMFQAWGWQYKTKAFSWCKLYPNPTSGFFIGMGYWTQANTEDVLLLTRGRPQRQSKAVAQLIATLEAQPYETPAVLAPLTRHSQKPEAIQDRIERLLPGPYLELFARRQRPNWTCLGNEVDGLDIRESLARLATDQPLPTVRTAVEQHSLLDAA